MAKRWTKEEESRLRSRLEQLYVIDNLPISTIARKLRLAEQTVFKRLVRLKIPAQRAKKMHANNKRNDICLPIRSNELAEFIGIMLGDGHISQYQIIVTLGNKELDYVTYVAGCMHSLFKVRPRIATRRDGYRDVYIGSIAAVDWLLSQGLTRHKVQNQVDVPSWIFEQKSYMVACLRGFFDTDGSVYKLKFGVQISLTNRSAPLLSSLQRMLRLLGYAVSGATLHRVYITRRQDVLRFFREINPANSKHQARFRNIQRRSDSGYSRRL